MKVWKLLTIVFILPLFSCESGPCSLSDMSAGGGKECTQIKLQPLCDCSRKEIISNREQVKTTKMEKEEALSAEQKTAEVNTSPVEVDLTPLIEKLNNIERRLSYLGKNIEDIKAVFFELKRRKPVVVKMHEKVEKQQSQRGELVVKGPAGAVIKINGKIYGTTSAVLNRVAPGTYRVEFIEKGFPPYSKEVALSAGERVIVDFRQRRGG